MGWRIHADDEQLVAMAAARIDRAASIQERLAGPILLIETRTPASACDRASERGSEPLIVPPELEAVLTALRLNELSAVDALLIRAVESEDSSAAVLTADDRRFATQAALMTTPLTEQQRPRDTAAFVTRRAALALERLASRYPAIERVRSMCIWPSWISFGVPAAALLLGLTSNELNGQRLNVLAFPMIGMLAWNFAVYFLILWHWLAQAVRGSTHTSHPLVTWLSPLLRSAGARLAAQPTLERAIARFARDWAGAVTNLTNARLTRTLHLGAAMFAIGLAAGMFLRARYTAEYTAGWAGTWAGAESEIRAVLKILLGPASAITHIPLPSLEHLRELRGGGENAGDWLKLWGVTAGLFVVGPRLVLAAWASARASVLARQITMEDDFYLRSLLRNALGRAGSTRVVPYGFEPSNEARERLTRVLAAATGDTNKFSIDHVIPYGNEDLWLDREGSHLSSSDQVILLFDLASTPETENQGAFVSGVREKLANVGTVLLVLLDDSSFRRKLKGQASAEKRVGERLNAWQLVLAGSGVTPAIVTLDSADEASTARTIEQSLLSQRVPA